MEKRKWSNEDGIAGPHGPLGTYAWPAGEYESRMATHLSYCNQCREDAGLPLLDKSPHPAPSEYHSYE